MVEGGDRASLALESGQSFRIAGNIRRQDLERYVAPQLHIGRAIHLTHSARANCGVDPVMCKCTSDQTQPPRVATHQLFVPDPRQQSYTKAAPSGLLASHGQPGSYSEPEVPFWDVANFGDACDCFRSDYGVLEKNLLGHVTRYRKLSPLHIFRKRLTLGSTLWYCTYGNYKGKGLTSLA
jgi:hypothetical protein